LWWGGPLLAVDVAATIAALLVVKFFKTFVEVETAVVAVADAAALLLVKTFTVVRRLWGLLLFQPCY
jgi:hypothetical protein